jgi:hypothetical protein
MLENAHIAYLFWHILQNLTFVNYACGVGQGPLTTCYSICGPASSFWSDFPSHESRGVQEIDFSFNIIARVVWQ